MHMKDISNREIEVMDILWDLKKGSVRDVAERMKSEQKLAYTTVATLLQRLYVKGFVKRKEEGIGYLYTPKLSKEAYTKNMAQSFLTRFIGSFGDIGIASFAESVDKLPEEKRVYFLKLLEEHDKNK